jgi:hypothetical protein
MWYYSGRDLASDVTTSKGTSTRLLAPGCPSTTAMEDVPSSDAAVGTRPALIHPVRGWGALRLRRALCGAHLAPYAVPTATEGVRRGQQPRATLDVSYDPAPRMRAPAGADATNRRTQDILET